MSELVKLFTQADLAELNAQLDTILKNLSAHTNMSLTKAHSVKVLPGASYYDSAGDAVNNRYAGAPYNIVLEFNFGEPGALTTIYVPARIVTGSTTVRDPGPRTISDGITFQATTPSGTSTSPGVPMAQKALVTTSPAAVAYEQSVVYNDLLLQHQTCTVMDLRELQCHGGLAYSTEETFDSLGHKMGRRTVNIGWGGVLYKLPGDTAAAGPPQTLRLLRCTTNANSFPWRNVRYHARDDWGEAYFYYMGYYGSPAATSLTWQMNDAGNYAWPRGAFTISSTWHDLGWIGASGSNPAGESGNWSVGVGGYLYVRFNNGSDDSKVKNIVRLKATSTAGTVYSNVCLCGGNDEDGGWFSDPDESSNTWIDGRLPGYLTLYSQYA